eukprot:COSAG06_NODE_1359_length_9719_cov_14.493971_8_plen_487_part_00
MQNGKHVMPFSLDTSVSDEQQERMANAPAHAFAPTWDSGGVTPALQRRDELILRPLSPTYMAADFSQMPTPSEPLGVRFRRYGGDGGTLVRYKTHPNHAMSGTRRLARSGGLSQLAERVVEDRENSTPALLDAVATAQAIRERERRVREMQTREEEERAAREEREEVARQAMGKELERMFNIGEDDERATKRHKGAGHQVGGHYVGVDSGEPTASQVSKYKHRHSKAQTESAKGAYLRKSGAVFRRDSKASTPKQSAKTKAKSPPAQKAKSPPAQKAKSPPAQKAKSPPAQKAKSPPAQKAKSPPAQKAKSPPAQKAKSPPAQTVASAQSQRKPKKAKPKSRGDQSIFDNKPDSPPMRAKVVDKRKETAERRKREAADAAKPKARKRKTVDPDVAKARTALKENKYRKGGLGDFKRFWDQRIVSEKRKLTQAEAKTMWDRQRSYDGEVAERKAERDREKELDRANRGMQSERFREQHRTKIPKKKR